MRPNTCNHAVDAFSFYVRFTNYVDIVCIDIAHIDKPAWTLPTGILSDNYLS